MKASAERYGLTIEGYNALLERQNNKCAVCIKDMLYPIVDHDHATGKVRGILCMSCNIKVANYGDNLDFMKKVIEYLKLPSIV